MSSVVRIHTVLQTSFHFVDILSFLCSVSVYDGIPMCFNNVSANICFSISKFQSDVFFFLFIFVFCLYQCARRSSRERNVPGGIISFFAQFLLFQIYFNPNENDENRKFRGRTGTGVKHLPSLRLILEPCMKHLVYFGMFFPVNGIKPRPLKELITNHKNISNPRQSSWCDSKH